ncbi:hypothetical protein Ancab_032748 [Ancistrocladus abbreviatus]
MFSSCSHLLSHRALSPPSLSGIRIPNRPPNLPPLARSCRLTDSFSRSPKNKWRICCFRQEELSAENLKPEILEDILAEELVKPKFDSSRVQRKGWATGLREFVDAVFRAIGTRWTVPWSGETILQVMLLWIASFWFVGSWMIPFAAHVAGFNKDALTYRGQALYSLLTDLTEGLAGIAILHRCLSRFRPLPSGWFSFSLKGNWHLDVALGCLMFPLVNRLSQFNLDLLPLLPSTPVTLSSVEQSILARDPVAMGLYAMVVSVCAPIWEEIVFRGFLLPSLTRYIPVWCSILVSSIVFALAHFNVQRMLPLIFLGVVMGVVFARSRNLVPSMLLHSLWNAFVFLDLMK